MKIAVKSIPASGVDIAGTLSQEDLNIRPEEIKCVESLSVKGRAQRQGPVIRAWGSARTKFRFVCGRCLESFDQDLDQEFDFHYTFDPQMTAIDVGEDIRQEIILNFPDKVMCGPDCRGLCARCGVNLNTGTCGCQK